MNRRTIQDFMQGVAFLCVLLLALIALAFASAFMTLRQRVDALENAASRKPDAVTLVMGPEPTPAPEPTHQGGGRPRVGTKTF